MICAGLLLASCAERQEGGGPIATPFQGAVIADEPRAALVGRDILLRGGNAADAAVATYFAMAVTLPSTASLGGGGACLVYDARLGRAESVEFLPVAPAGRAIAAVPGNPRGMFAVHRRLGRQRWEEVLAPAESIARFGTQASRALAQDVALAWSALIDDPDGRRIFGKGGEAGASAPPAQAPQARVTAPEPRVGRARAAGLAAPAVERRATPQQRAGIAPIGEGDTVIQTDLADFIARLRQRGAADLQSGELAQQFSAATARAQAPLGTADLNLAPPQFRASAAVTVNEITLHSVPPPAAAGVMTAQIWGLAGPRWRQTAAGDRPHLLAQASMLAHADRERWQRAGSVNAAELVSPQRFGDLGARAATGRIDPATLNPRPVARPVNPGASKVLVMDREGNAVACSFTVNGLFGLARIAPGTGVVLAAASTPNDNGGQWLGPVIAARGEGGGAIFAAAGAGGAVTPSTVAQVALDTLVAERGLGEAIAAPRVNYVGTPDRADVEQGASEIERALGARGYPVGAVPRFGNVGGFHCPDGPQRSARCEFVADPRGSGLAVVAN
jgi:gamma-glutamyltranspeptidase/glutathione hydrolase